MRGSRRAAADHVRHRHRGVKVEPDEDGWRWASPAQHVATKRALAGLQRKGLVIGFRSNRIRAGDDSGRTTELCHIWITEKRLTEQLDKMLAQRGKRPRGISTNYDTKTRKIVRLVRKAAAGGMKVEQRFIEEARWADSIGI